MITQSHQANVSGKGDYNKELLRKMRTKTHKKNPSKIWKLVKLGKGNSFKTLQTENEPYNSYTINLSRDRYYTVIQIHFRTRKNCSKVKYVRTTFKHMTKYLHSRELFMKLQ